MVLLLEVAGCYERGSQLRTCQVMRTLRKTKTRNKYLSEEMQEKCDRWIFEKVSGGLNLLEQTLMLVWYHGESCPVSKVTGEKHCFHELVSTPSTTPLLGLYSDILSAAFKYL